MVSDGDPRNVYWRLSKESYIERVKFPVSCDVSGLRISEILNEKLPPEKAFDSKPFLAVM